MGYTRGGLRKNGHGIVVPITSEMNSPRTSLGYDIVVASLPTPEPATTREILFVLRGVQTGLLVTCHNLKILLQMTLLWICWVVLLL